MKLKFLIFFTVFLLLIIYSCSLSGDKKNEKGAKNVSDTTNNSFTVEVTDYWANKKIKSVTNYVNGKREGLCKNYDQYGKLLSEVPYSNNMITGTGKNYYPNGALHSEISYVNHVKNGVEKWYYENGALYQESNYRSGMLNGIQKKYHKNGKIMSECIYMNNQPGAGLKEYDTKGMLIKAPYIVVKETNNTAINDEYIITLSLSDNRGRVSFYSGELTDGKFFNYYLSPVASSAGKGKITIKVQKGTFMMHKLNIIAHRKTDYHNYYIIQKTLNLALENRY